MQDTSNSMPRSPKGVAIVVIVVMLACAANIAINDSFDHGSGMDTFNAGAANPWQLFINMDLISGLFFVLAWLIWRERGSALIDIIAWSALLLWWGNIVTAVYVLAAAWQSKGRADAFFMGARAGMLASLRAIIPLRIVAMLGAIASVALMIRGLLAVGFTGMPAFGYYAACGTIAFALATFALGRRRSTLL